MGKARPPRAALSWTRCCRRGSLPASPCPPPAPARGHTPPPHPSRPGRCPPSSLPGHLRPPGLQCDGRVGSAPPVPTPTSSHLHFPSAAASHGLHGSHGVWSHDAKCVWGIRQAKTWSVANPPWGTCSGLLWTPRGRFPILLAGERAFL